MIRVAILISGRGSNMLQLADSITAYGLDVEITLVASNKPCDGINCARERGLNCTIIDRAMFTSKAEQESALADAILSSGADWVFLAGYMAILSADFVARFERRIINIHPSLLPEFKGLDTHERALASGAMRHGATVHLVTPALDDGPIIVQAGLTIMAEETTDELASRVLTLEHALYPLVLSSLARGQLTIDEAGVTWIDQEAALGGSDADQYRILEAAIIWPAKD